MASRGKSARQKGHSYERKLRKELLAFFPLCQTSRYESRKRDDEKVDLCHTAPFNIQAKAVERFTTYFETLNEMPDDENYNLIFHKKNHKGEIVIMKKEDFYEIVKMLKTEKII